MRTYKATITPTVSGGNIEVKISANSATQAQELVKTLPYFKSFVRQPFMTNEEDDNNLEKISQITKRAQAKDQAKLVAMEELLEFDELDLIDDD
jgi:hypothetical protein